MRQLIILSLVVIPFFSVAQKQQPKLVIGIVVDQMRYDYLTRYWDKYGEGGFKKLINEGFNCKNTNYNYMRGGFFSYDLLLFFVVIMLIN